MTHMVRVRSNIKQGVDAPLSMKTIIVGNNRSGKTSILQGIELAVCNTVSDLEGRDTVKAQNAILRVFPKADKRFFSSVEMSDGTRFGWSLNLLGGSSPKPERSAPYAVSFLTRELSAALRGNGSTIRKFMFSHVCGSNVWSKVYMSLSADEHQTLATLGMNYDPGKNIDPEIVASTISAKVLKLKKEAKVQLEIAESMLAGLKPVSPQEQQKLHTEQAHYAVALRAKKDGLTQEHHEAIVAEIDDRASRIAVDFGMERDIPEHLTAPLVELHERLKASVVCRTGDLVTDLILVTSKLVTNEAAAKAFSAAAAKRKEHDFLMDEAEKLRELAGTISKMGEYHFSQAMLHYQEAVNDYLPSHLGSFFMDLTIMRIGLLMPDGSFRTALSGAEQVAVHMAMASVFPEGHDGAARLITAPDVAWDKGTLSDCMRALVNSPHQIVLTSTIMPEDVSGWQVVVLGG
jgi:hypothetical protein